MSANWETFCRNYGAYAITKARGDGLYIGGTAYSYLGGAVPVEALGHGDVTEKAVAYDGVDGYVNAGDWVGMANWDEGFTFGVLYSGFTLTSKHEISGSSGAKNTCQIILNGASAGDVRMHVQNEAAQKNRADITIGSALSDGGRHSLVVAMSGGAAGDNTARCAFDGVNQTSIAYTYQAMTAANWDTPTRNMMIASELGGSLGKYFPGTMARLVHFHDYLSAADCVNLSEALLSDNNRHKRSVNTKISRRAVKTGAAVLTTHAGRAGCVGDRD